MNSKGGTALPSPRAVHKIASSPKQGIIAFNSSSSRSLVERDLGVEAPTLPKFSHNLRIHVGRPSVAHGLPTDPPNFTEVFGDLPFRPHHRRHTNLVSHTHDSPTTYS
jgi:hypothetical protein